MITDTLADDVIGDVDVDSLTPEFCIYCTTALVDPDVAPYCGPQCSISAQEDD